MDQYEVKDAAFGADNRRLKTISCLLSWFDARDNTLISSKTPKPDAFKNLKRMLMVSSLLTRGLGEVVACMGTRSVDGFQLFCATGQKHSLHSERSARHSLFGSLNPEPEHRSNLDVVKLREVGEDSSFESTVPYIMTLW